MKHLFIINPIAGSEDCAKKAEEEIRRVMPKAGEKWEAYHTIAPMDAMTKVRSEVEKYGEGLRVYACGGDGTLNECVNGVAEARGVAVTHVPLGSGNDFIKMFGEDRRLFSDLEKLIKGYTIKVDMINCNGRYAINICSVGIDARIGTQVHKYRLFKGKMRYALSLVVNFAKGIAHPMEVRANGRHYSGDFSLVCACNGRFYGSMFEPVPDADPADGIIDFLLVDGVGRLKFLKLVGKYAKGRYREIDQITHLRGEEMTIISDTEMVVNLDGEAIYAKEVCLNLLPGVLNFIVPHGIKLPDGFTVNISN